MSSRKPQLWITTLLSALCVFWLTLSVPVHALGVNWGTEASHPLPPSTIVQLLKANNIQKVKLFDSNSSVVNALANTGIEVMVAIPNDLLQSMTDLAQANAWVQNNVVRYLYQFGTSIKYVAVGNEPFLKAYNGTYDTTTYPALVSVQQALINANLGDEIKVTVPLNADILSSSQYPSQTIFRDDIAQPMANIVAFLAQHNCPFTINFYPFLSLYDDKNFPVGFAFFDNTSAPLVDSNYNDLTYYNVFDASYDSLVGAFSNLNEEYNNLTIVIGEIGWPTDGDVNANMNYAQKFNQGFLNHVLSNVGTPRRPNTAIDFYLFSLIDEDEKSIAPGNFERHWGLYMYDGTPKYSLSLSGSNGQNLVQAQGVHYLQQQWCVLNPNAGDMSSLGDSITYACTYSDCTSLGYGCSCNPYLDANGNASYAFNQYFQRQNQALGTCDFNGLAQIVSQNPSINVCDFMIQIASDGIYTSVGTYRTRRQTPVLISAAIMLMYFLL